MKLVIITMLAVGVGIAHADGSGSAKPNNGELTGYHPELGSPAAKPAAGTGSAKPNNGELTGYHPELGAPATRPAVPPPPAAGSGATAPAAGAPAVIDAPPAACVPASDLRKVCAAAMNADPAFAKAIVEVADKDAADRRLAATEAEHLDAAQHVAKDEKHVILAYAAMWIIAAGFVVFLWRRQQALKAEIAQLRGDLEKEAK